ncbi:MAG: DUF3105 domain-containing protein [Marmoricola sp.]
MVEQMRAEQARKERMRSLAILGTCVLVVIGLLGVAVFKYVADKRDQDALDNLTLQKIGVPASAAGCESITTEKPTGSNKSGAPGSHVAIGTKVTYPTAPPAFGQHWPNFLTSVEYRNFYSPKDRPEIERMVHGLEHGHTLIWYDDTIKVGSAEYKDLQAIANKYDGTTTYVNILPWTSADGSAFKDDKHVVLTHWAGRHRRHRIGDMNVDARRRSRWILATLR